MKVQKEQDIKIDLVCFTGDLIQRGDKALDDEKQLEIAEEILVNPLLNSLGLENNKFIIIPGNHEVDVKKIVKATEKGLLVDSLEEINDNVSDMNESYLARLDYFYQYIGWSSCDNICMDMHALICVLRPQKCVAIWLHLRLLHTFWYLALS